jgi:hypothetical protein
VFSILVIAGISLSSIAASAEEQLAGHYFPGALSSFIDLLPAGRGSSTFAISNDSTYYHGSNNALRLNATSYTNSSVFLYQLPGLISILPGKPQYSVALAVPYTWLKVHAPVINSKGMFVPAKDTDNGFGDIEMFPVMLNWAEPGENKYFHCLSQYQTEFGIFAPTGHFHNTGLANIGRNYWTFEPSAVASYLVVPSDTPRYAFQLTTSAGFDFNTKNGATHYQTGDQFHLDGTLAAYRVLSGGEGEPSATAGVGVSGFFYQQITGDTGRGAILGSFEAMTTGVGPDLSYIYKNKGGDVTIAGEVKWLPELSVSNRLSGNIVWLKLIIAWGTPSKKPPQAAAFAPGATAAPNLRALDVIPSL